MLVHFIGGPAHGTTEAIQHPHERILMPRPANNRCYAACEAECFPPSTPRWDTVEYKIIRHTPRYCIAEFVEALVAVRFTVDVNISPFDSQATEELSRFMLALQKPAPGKVKCIAGSRSYHSGAVQLTLETRVEGPKDPTAIQIAAEEVQHYLHAHFPAARFTTELTAAETV